MAGEDIVYVDDENSFARIMEGYRPLKGRVNYLTPEEASSAATQPQATGKNLWIFDFFYDEQGGIGLGASDSPRVAFGRPTGLSILKSWETYYRDSRPPSLLISSHLQSALGEDTVPERRHALAIHHDVDWVVPRDKRGIDTLKEIAQLADACKAAREAIAASPNGRSVEGIVGDLLALPADKDWQADALVALWRSPIPRFNQLSSMPPDGGDAGLATSRLILVWLLHKLLPYPGALLSDAQAAARLGLKPAAFRKMVAAKGRTKFARELRDTQYLGLLHDFGGRRWWRAGIDLLAWNVVNSGNGLVAEMERYVDRDGMLVDADDPVVVSDDNLVETDRIESAHLCVRLVDEHAPPDALPIWLPIEEVRNDGRLRELVLFEDRRQLESVG